MTGRGGAEDMQSRADRMRVVVVGGGPAGMMAAETVATALGGRVAVTIVERMPSPARKFLMAGRGGLNLTHGEAFARFLSRYHGGGPALRRIVEAFPPQALREWCEGLGQETFVGSSGRVFPRAFKASPLLRAWLARLAGLGVAWRLRTAWTGFDGPGGITIATPQGSERLPADAVVLALGGASWPRLGSDGGWIPVLAAEGIRIAPLRPANAGFRVAWSPVFADRFAGTPLKSAGFAAGGTPDGGGTLRGEAVVTRSGIEGGAIYALSVPLRAASDAEGRARLRLDLKPDLSVAVIQERLARARAGLSTSNLLRTALGLAPVAIGVLREAAGRDLPSDPAALAALVKRAELTLGAPQGLDRAISTAGGVAWSELDEALMLRRLPGVFVAGEMLDWEAPTGGYLLQACFATGVAAGQGAAAWLGRGSGP